MKKNFLVLLIILLAINLNAQNIKEVIAPSPTTAELGKYGMVPVGLFSGTAQYSVPLYELKTKNLSVPISLSYSSNGLVVDQVSTWVGHSWSLNAGGVITRSVRGLPDNPAYSLPYPDGVDTDPYLLFNFLDGHRLKCDVEPDIYAFNFMGYQGKFFIDTDDKVYMTPYESLKIIVDPSKNFIITTPDGVKFSFQTKELFWCTGGCNDYTEFTSAWYLTKIEHPAGDIINFNYSAGENLYYNSGISETINRVLYTNGPCGSGNSDTNPIDGGIRASASSSLTSHLVSITTNGSGSIEFQSTKDRLDLVDDYKLDLITIFNNEHTPIKSFSFNFIFPAANVNYNPLASITYSLNSNHTTELNYRMYLNHLTINNPQDNKTQVFSFEYYNLDNLPRRLSLAQDYFGYFNGVTYNTHFVPSDMISAFDLSKFPGITGNRHPNGAYSINGTMKKITYPTGGFTKIYYEPHESTFGEIGGCRVQKTESFDNINPVPNVKEYTYSDGNLYGLPSYYRNYEIQRYSGCDNRCITYYGSITSSSLYSINHNGQYPVVYSCVDVSDGVNFQNGGTRYGFKIAYDDKALIIGYSGGIVYPLPKGNQGWSNGTKESEETKKRLDNGTLVTLKREEFHYNYTESRSQKIRSCLSRNENGNGKAYDPCVIHAPVYDLIGYDVVKYSLISQWCPLTAKTTTIYDSNGQNPVETSIFYTYGNETHAQVTKEVTTDSKGNLIRKNIYYPDDYSLSYYNLWTLKYKNIINVPIDTRKYVNNILAEGQQTIYNDYGQPTDTYMAETNGTDVPFNYYNLYTFTHRASYFYDYTPHNLNQITKDNNFSTSYLWGYNNTLPVAKFDNMTYSAISSNSTLMNFVNQLQNYTDLTDPAVRSNLKTLNGNIRSNVPANAQVTTYTYSPLIGMTSQTDPNGITTYYEYDTFGRLKLIRDDQNNILKKIDYHYSTQN